MDAKTWNLALGLRATSSISQILKEIRRLGLSSNRAAINYKNLWSADGVDQVQAEVKTTMEKHHKKIPERVAYRMVLESVLETYRAMMRGEKMPKDN